MQHALQYDMPTLSADDVDLAIEEHPDGVSEPLLILKHGDAAREVWLPFQGFLLTICPDSPAVQTLDSLVESVMSRTAPGQEVYALIGLASFHGYEWEVYAESFHCVGHDRVELEYVGHIAHSDRTIEVLTENPTERALELSFDTSGLAAG